MTENNWKNYDFSKVILQEFKPRVFAENDCKCENKEIIMRKGRIESAKCLDCGNVVCS